MDWYERSFHSHSTRSRPIPEVKLGRAQLVVRFVRTCEACVLFVLLFFFSIFSSFLHVRSLRTVRFAFFFLHFFFIFTTMWMQDDIVLQPLKKRAKNKLGARSAFFTLKLRGESKKIWVRLSPTPSLYFCPLRGLSL